MEPAVILATSDSPCATRVRGLNPIAPHAIIDRRTLVFVPVVKTADEQGPEPIEPSAAETE
jgi:hypothetical protein